MKKILTVLAVLLMAIGYTTFTANANDYADMTAGEELVSDTAEIAAEAEAEFETAVECAEDAMSEGDDASTDCVSEEGSYEDEALEAVE